MCSIVVWIGWGGGGDQQCGDDDDDGDKQRGDRVGMGMSYARIGLGMEKISAWTGGDGYDFSCPCKTLVSSNELWRTIHAETICGDLTLPLRPATDIVKGHERSKSLSTLAPGSCEHDTRFTGLRKSTIQQLALSRCGWRVDVREVNSTALF